MRTIRSTLLYLYIISILLLKTPVYGMEKEGSYYLPAKNEQELTHILEASQRGPVYLALGVSNKQAHEKGLTKEWVCWDNNHDETISSVLTLTGNFNDAGLWKELAQRLPEVFSSIVMDCFTFKFTEMWTTVTLGYFSAMLKDEGTFIIPPSIQCFNSVNLKEICFEEVREAYINLASTEKILWCNMCIPNWKGVKITLTSHETEEIEALVKKHQEILLPVVKEFEKTGENHELINVLVNNPELVELPQATLENKEQLFEEVKKASIHSSWEKIIIQDGIEHNWLRLFKQVFGKENVTYNLSGELPFPWRKGHTEPQIEAIKVKREAW